MSLFDGFRKKKAGIPEVKQNEPEKESPALPKVNPENTESEGYYFENPIELAIYGKLYAKDKTVYWLSGDKYLVEYKKGYQLFEQGQYSRAIEAYKKCLELNPIGLSARFEICESYLKIGNLSSARNTLLEMKDFLIEEKNIARFYRRMGYIEIEKGNYMKNAAEAENVLLGVYRDMVQDGIYGFHLSLYFLKIGRSECTWASTSK